MHYIEIANTAQAAALELAPVVAPILAKRAA